MGISIAVDAMGGDHGPPVIVVASIQFLEETPDASVILVGREGDIRKALSSVRSTAADRVSVRAATEVVEMHEGPASALRGKKDSSMRVAVKARHASRALFSSQTFPWSGTGQRRGSSPPSHQP